MNEVKIKVVYPEQFKLISEQLYHQIFNQQRNSEIDRIDFACVFFYGDKPSGYVSCYEHSSKVLYMQFGGAFPEYRNSSLVYKSYRQLVEQMLTKYDCLRMRVDRDNIPMLKLAFKCGWKIVGTIFDESCQRLLVELSIFKDSKTQTKVSSSSSAQTIDSETHPEEALPSIEPIPTQNMALHNE